MSNLFMDFGKSAQSAADLGKRRAPIMMDEGAKQARVQGASFGSFSSSTARRPIGIGSMDSPAQDDSIPSLLDIHSATPSVPLGSGKTRPEDPLGNKLTPKEVYDSIPEGIRMTMDEMKAAGVGNSEQTGKLKFHLNTLMHEGKNPFPVVRLYKEFIGPVQLGRVLNAGIVRKLDYYWEHWELPPPGAPTTEQKAQQQSQFNWMRLEKLGPSKNAPKAPKEDPLSYKPEEIVGVGRDPDTGRYVASNDTVRWIRTQAYVIHKSGQKEEKYEPFLDLMKGYFGDVVVQRAINQSQEARNEKAAATAAVTDEDKPTNPEADDLHWLMHHMTVRHIPDLAGDESLLGFKESTAQWIQSKAEKMLANCLNPDPFFKKLTDMFSLSAVHAVLNADARRSLTAGIRNLPSSVSQPEFLISLLKKGGGADVTTSPAATYGRPPAPVPAPVADPMIARRQSMESDYAARRPMGYGYNDPYRPEEPLPYGGREPYSPYDPDPRMGADPRMGTDPRMEADPRMGGYGGRGMEPPPRDYGQVPPPSGLYGPDRYDYRDRRAGNLSGPERDALRRMDSPYDSYGERYPENQPRPSPLMPRSSAPGPVFQPPRPPMYEPRPPYPPRGSMRGRGGPRPLFSSRPPRPESFIGVHMRMPAP